MLDKVICYEELAALVNKDLRSNNKLPSVLVLDVRNPGEIEKHGRIKNSVNFPLKSLENILNLLEQHLRAQKTVLLSIQFL